MKTLCYKFVFCLKGLLYNDGFIIAEIEDGSIKNIEGLLTDEYVEGKVVGDKIEIIIYSRNSKGKLEETHNVKVKLTKFKLPLYIRTIEDKNQIIELKTGEKITGHTRELKRSIKNFKDNNVFEKERN